jgi:S-adenosylmethionine uptake transporter
MTKAYQCAPAAMVSAASYTTPVFNLIVSIFIFGLLPNNQSFAGAGVVLVAGIALPFLQGQRVLTRARDIPAEMTDR